MKNTLLKLIAILSLAASAQAAVTFSFANYTGSALGPNGLPFVDSAGASILNSSNTLFASIGYLSAGGDNSASSVLSRFNALDSTPMNPITSPTNRNGLFNGPDYDSAGNVYPAGFQGNVVTILIHNTSAFANATAIAAFTLTGTTFLAPDPVTFARVQNFQLTSASVPVVGTLRTVTTQPNTPGASPFVNGVQLVAIPETSTSLLGAIGALALLRRRRN
jgi:hypothetical protein